MEHPDLSFVAIDVRGQKLGAITIKPNDAEEPVRGWRIGIGVEEAVISLQVKRIFHRNRVKDMLLTPAMVALGVSVPSERTLGQVSARSGRGQEHTHNQGYMTLRRK